MKFNLFYLESPFPQAQQFPRGSLSKKISLPGSIDPFSHHLPQFTHPNSRRVQVNPCISPVDLHNGVSVHTNRKKIICKVFQLTSRNINQLLEVLDWSKLYLPKPSQACFEAFSPGFVLLSIKSLHPEGCLT